MTELFLSVHGFHYEQVPLETLSENAFDFFKTFVDELTKESYGSIDRHDEISGYITYYLNFKQCTRDGLLGKTAQLLVSYMDHI